MAQNLITEFDQLSDKWKPVKAALNAERMLWRGISLASLGSIGARFAVDCVPFEKIEGEWKASRWVGNFTFDGQSWRIMPRVGWPRFVAMLSTAFSVGVNDGGGLRAGDGNDGNLIPLAWVLAFESAWRQHRGAAKSFVRREVTDAPALRGELNLALQLDKLVDRHAFACRYDELTYDNPVNRGALLAIKLLKQHGRFPFYANSGRYHRIAREWQEALLANRVETPAHFPAEAMRWSRANDRFRAAHALSELVVAERQITASAGRTVTAFLFDSAEVWELYLWRQLQCVVQQSGKFSGFSVEWPREHQGEPEALLLWQGRRVGWSIPDLRIRRPDGSLALIVDAKYRYFRPPTEDGEIALQMFNYVAIASQNGEKCPPATLLYPDFERLDRPKCCDINGPRELGRGLLLTQGGVSLSAWAVQLPPVDKKNDSQAFQKCVREQLEEILRREILS